MTYHENLNAQNTLRLRELLKTLPQFAAGYFRSVSEQTASLTRLAYAYDLRLFFTFLSEEVLYVPPAEISVEQMQKIDDTHIEEFMEYLTYYVPISDSESDEKPVQNAVAGKSRKLAAVRRLFKYLYKRKYISANPAELVDFPRLKEQPITTLEADEVARLLDEVDSGENLTKHQKAFHARTRLRDAAIITLLLGTGMRVSECVGIDLSDIDFEVNGLRVVRKGGDAMILYFGDEVRDALCAWLDRREEIEPLPGHENALFISLHSKRITTRAVQKLVKKYAALITKLKNISPHKLRSTFGTRLYSETGDIYLVANVLGHSDINTTRKHYAKMDDAHRRKAANIVKLRDS
ncbi:MAG: tyrosine-type recombinase/integrase [Defluviitaleaceae bacterium]|nr:tyrosine-type recombinase/integrase [Defluviitaleaceae bacterium]